MHFCMRALIQISPSFFPPDPIDKMSAPCEIMAISDPVKLMIYVKATRLFCNSRGALWRRYEAAAVALL